MHSAQEWRNRTETPRMGRFLHLGARRQGALAPQLLRATRSSDFPLEDLCIYTDFGCFTGYFFLCFRVITMVTIVRLLTPKTPHFSDRGPIIALMKIGDFLYGKS